MQNTTDEKKTMQIKVAYVVDKMDNRAIWYFNHLWLVLCSLWLIKHLLQTTFKRNIQTQIVKTYQEIYHSSILFCKLWISICVSSICTQISK